MNTKDIQIYFALVGRELEDMGVREPVRLLLVGGGYMLTQVKNRKTTGDIDLAWVQPVYAGSELDRLLRLAVESIAEREDLDPDWLNTTISDLLHASEPLPKLKLWKKFKVVHVYLPPKDFILAYKLLAGRPKDRPDIEVLCTQLGIDSRDEARKLVDKYVHKEVQEIYDIDRKLGNLFSV